jgi:hypothetical protein
MATSLLDDLQTVLAALVPSGGAHYQVNVKKLPVLPYIVYMRIVSVPNVTLQGSSALQNTHFQIDIYSKGIAAAEAISKALLPALEAGPWKSVVERASRDMYDFEARLSRISRDFSIWATN